MTLIGHRLKALRICNVHVDIVAHAAVSCPNLESLTISFGINNIEADKITPLSQMSRLRVLHDTCRVWADEEVLELFERLPTLREVTLRLNLEGNDLKNFNIRLAELFPDVVFEFI